VAPGLDKRVVPILLRGLDEGQPRQIGIAGSLDVLQNMIVQKAIDGGYEFAPRPGTTNVSKTADVGSITTGLRLGTLGPALILLTGTSCYRKAVDQWHQVDATAPTIGVDTRMISSGAIVAESSDYAYVNGYTLGVVSYYDGKLWSVRVEAADSTGATVFSTVLATSATSVIGSVKIAVSSTFAVVFWAPTDSNSIVASKFDSAAPSAMGSPVVVTTADAGLLYDVQTVGATGRIVVTYSSGGAITQRLLTVSSMAVSGATTYAGLNTLVTFGLLTNDYSSNTIYLGTIAAAGLQVSTFDGTTLALGATTTYDATQTVGFNLSGYRTGASVTVFFTSAPTPPPGISVCDYLIKTSTGGAASTIQRSMSLASRVALVGSSLYALVQYRAGTGASVAQSSTYFLMNLSNVRSVGMALKNLGSIRFYASGGNHLQNLRAGASASTLLTAGFKVIAVATDTASFAPYVAGAAITFTLQDTNIGRPVELNSVLHIPGAQPYLYDGLTLTEHGFPIDPDPGGLSPAAGGGMTSSVVYTYLYVDEWTDAAGNLWRSNRSLPQSVTMGAADTKVTHSIPTLRLTRKTNVSKGIYRTLANGDGSVYYKVSSTTAPLFNDPTVDRISFVDTVSDATAVTGEPIYSPNDNAGSVLPNIALPGCRVMAVHRGRLLAAGIEGDTSAIWFSKDVVPGFGVEFSDFLVSRITGVEPITAVGSMDSYAVACTKTQSWGSINEYPDDTGAGGVLVFQQQSDSTGCAIVGLLGRNDLGMMTYGGFDKGIWRASRGLSWDYIGNPVEDTMKTVTPVAFLSVPGQNQMRVVGGVTAFVFEAIYGQWAIWSYPTAPAAFVDAVLWNGSPAYLCSEGTVIVESTIASGVISDAGTMPQHTLKLSGLSLFGVAGFGRLYITQITGRPSGSLGFTLNLAQEFDGVAIPTKTEVYTGSETELFVEVDPGTMGKSSRYDLTISDTANGANSAFTVAAITALVGTKAGLSKLPTARRAT
jgi:hypothetical protein